MQKLIRSFLLLITFIASSAFAAPAAFDRAAFDALQKDGKPTLVMIHAVWCSTCKAQEPIVSELLSAPDYKSLHALRVDFDKQKDVVKSFKATAQSTLIVFKSGKEVGRSTGDTEKDSIAGLLKKAV